MNEDFKDQNLNLDISLDRGGDPDPNNYKFKLKRRNKGQAGNDLETTQDGIEGKPAEKEQTNVPSSIRPSEAESQKNKGGVTAVCSLAYWQPLFTLENKEFGERVASSLNVFWAQKFVDKIKAKPDLYGPIWIASGLAFMCIVSSSFYDIFARILVDSQRTTSHDYNFANLGFVFMVIYGLLFIVPILLTLGYSCSASTGPSNFQVLSSNLDNGHVGLLFSLISIDVCSSIGANSLAQNNFVCRRRTVPSNRG